MDVNFLEPHYPYHGRHKKKMMLVIFSCFVVGALFIGATWAGARMFGANNGDHATQQLAPIDTSFWGKLKSLFVSANRPLIGYDQDRVSIALFGIGGEGHDGPQLTDTILVASIKPSTKQVSLLSVPRDTVVNIPGDGWRKINEANSFAETQEPGSGGKFASGVLSDFLGTPIQYYVRVDFGGFAQVIDDIGGVDVYVDRPFTDNQFPTLDYKVRTISFEKGWQHMDGARALDYARSRHGNNFEGSDFARAHRQQKIILAVRDKLLTSSTLLNPALIARIINTLDTHIQTNIQFNDFMEFMRIGRGLDTSHIITTVFSDDPASVLFDDVTPDGFYLRPKDPTLQEIHTLVAHLFDTNGTQQKTLIDQEPLQPIPVDDARIEVQNGTWRPGFAARQKDRLTSDKYTVSAIGNAATRPVSQAEIFDVTHKHSDTIKKLLDRYHAAEVTTRPAPSPDNASNPPHDIDIIVVLGENVPDIAP